MTDFYTVLSDMGGRPEAYCIATIGEIRSFIDGYRFAIRQNECITSEVPPFCQFTEWLVRKLERGNTSFGWWQLIRWNDLDEASAIHQFGLLISEFAKRKPARVAEVKLDTSRHVATGKLRFGCTKNGIHSDLSSVVPSFVRLTKYTTDEGVYLVYKYDLVELERYFSDILAAKRCAYEDFQIADSDWSACGSIDHCDRGSF